MRTFVTGLLLIAATPAYAADLLEDLDAHLAVSAGGGLAHGVAGVKLELRLGPIAAFGFLGMVGVSGFSPGPRYGGGARVYLFRTERGAVFASVEYAQSTVSYRERPACCEWFEIKEANLGGVLGYRYAFRSGFFGEIGIGPAWNWYHQQGVGSSGTYSDGGTQERFGLTKELKMPNFDLALGFGW